MIQWKVFINSTEESSCISLFHGEKLQIRETDTLVFSVQIDAEDFSMLGTPTIVVSDIPLTMILQGDSESNDYYTFISNELIDSHKAKYFYNFFGESEVILYFDNSFDDAISTTFDILARKENAAIANQMLGFLTDNLDDAIAICFSRSKRGADLLGEDGHNFNKLDVISQTLIFLNGAVNKFIRERKSTISSDIILSENGHPTGPDSVYWALTNLDKLSPANQDSVNVYFNNRGYHYEKLPKEILIDDYDVYENRVINSFLVNAENFLYSLKSEYSIDDLSQNNLNTDFVRFDHTMAEFSRMALDVKVKEVEHLIIKIRGLRRLYRKVIPSKCNVRALPRMTSYVAKKNHYREAFSLIEKFYRAQAPDFSKNRLLLGLKNLSIIYELTALLMLHKGIENIFNVTLLIQNFRIHAESHPFGGEDAERPEGIVNNHFVFDNSEYLIDLLYEAKIYPYSASSRPGDLIDTSNTNGSIKYGKHHFCPDFILKVTSKKWGTSFTAILDAKYKDFNTIKNYDVDLLTNKYLLNIHEVSDSGGIQMSPIDILIILFAHDNSGTRLRRVAPRHCLTGQFPVFPQSTAIALHPNDTSLLNEHLEGVKKLISSGSVN